MSKKFEEPWIAVGDDASNLTDELERELSKVHPLWRTKVQAIARRIDSDDVLFSVSNENGEQRFAVVHLTWTGRPEVDPGYPHVEFFESLEQWRRDRMIPDITEFSSH